LVALEINPVVCLLLNLKLLKNLNPVVVVVAVELMTVVVVVA
jgi:hypothetical protein